MKKLDTLSDRVKFLLEINGLSVSAAAKKCGMAQPRLYEIVIGKTINPHQKTIERIAGGFNVSRGWLSNNEGEMRQAPPLPADLVAMVNEYQAEYNGAPMQLARDEYALIQLYRQLNNENKDMIMMSAGELAKSGKD